VSAGPNPEEMARWVHPEAHPEGIQRVFRGYSEGIQRVLGFEGILKGFFN